MSTGSALAAFESELGAGVLEAVDLEIGGVVLDRCLAPRDGDVLAHPIWDELILSYWIL